MKILAFNASPRKEGGTTDIVVDRFIEGAVEAGAEVDKHYVVDLDINGCRGCFGCWLESPGRCVQRDDMDWVLPAINESDVLLLGTPIYGRNVTSYLARLAERTFPNNAPEMYIEDGRTRHPGRTRKIPKIVLAATCGFPDLVNFDVVRSLYPSALHILLPASQIILNDEGREYLSGFIDSVRLAGYKVARGEEIPGPLREKLVMDYSDEVKRLIVERHNVYSAAATRKGQ